jgi:arylsulfatase A-like enzyme
MNVIIIVADALRASDVGCLGREVDITPNIDSLAEESMVFEKAFSVSNKTDISMSTILSGKTPREHGVKQHGTVNTESNLNRIRERSPTFLPEILHDAGYTTIGVDWMGRWHAWGYDRYGVEDGGRDINVEADSLFGKVFDYMTDTVTELPDPLLFPIMKAYYRWSGYDDYRVDCEELTDIAIDRINGAEKPFFTLIHYWDIHPPYLPPDEYTRRFSYDGGDEPLSEYFGTGKKGPLAAEYPPYALGNHTTVGESKEAYDGAIAWVDEQIGRLMEFLQKKQTLDDTMIIVTADHGHNFGEHGIFSDNSGLFDTSIHVPLVIYDPRKGHQRINDLVQHTDLMPTILDYVGIKSSEELRGNVLPEAHEYVFAETIERRMEMIRTDEWKLVVPRDLSYLRDQPWYNGDGQTELYDLKGDPGETRNVAAEHPNVLTRLEKLLQEEIRSQQQVAGAGGRRSAGIKGDDMSNIKSRLSALGYADEDNI